MCKGRGWSHAAASQGNLSLARSKKKLEEKHETALPQSLRKQPTLKTDLRLPSFGTVRVHFCCFKSPSLW